jgi:transcriptional regulator with XRE-family HTH domain
MRFDSKKIKEARVALRLSGEDFCDLLIDNGLKISRQTLSNWETGETSPTVDQFAVLFVTLNQPISFFFADKMNCTGSVDK